MKKKIDRKMNLNRETLRALNPSDMSNVAGGEPTEGTACTSGSNTNATCDTCFGWSCKRGDC